MQFLLAQLTPHFLFNSLNGVLALVQDDPEAGRAMLRDLRSFVERLLIQERSIVSTVREELQTLDGYVAIQRRRFPRSFHFVCDVETSAFDLEIPTFLLQPFVENAIRHGLLESGGGSIRIGMHREGSRLLISIEDSGRSFLAGGVRERIGLSNSRARLQAMYGNDHLLEIRRSPLSGMIITIDIPARTPYGKDRLRERT